MPILQRVTVEYRGREGEEIAGRGRREKRDGNAVVWYREAAEREERSLG